MAVTGFNPLKLASSSTDPIPSISSSSYSFPLITGIRNSVGSPFRRSLKQTWSVRAMSSSSSAAASSSASFGSRMEESIKKTVTENTVVVYSKTWCSYCSEVKTLFKRLGVQPLVIELDELDHNEFHGRHTTAAAVNHSYLAYVGQGPAATPRTSDNNNSDEHPWNSLSNDHFHQIAVAPQYHHHSPPFSLPSAHVVDGETDSSAARGISYPHPFLFSYRSNPRRTSPANNVHQGSSTQMREHIHTQQHHVFNNHRQHHANGPNLAPPLVSMTRRGLPPRPPPMPDQNVGFFIYPPPSSSGGHHEQETDQLHVWERDWFPHFPVPSSHRTISSFWHRHF